MNIRTLLLRHQKILLDNTQIYYNRFLYDEIPDEERLVWIVWLRGTGKTTILLQKLKNNINFERSIYFSLDNTLIKKDWLFKTVSELYFDYSYRYFYIDEIHKYKNWNQELKNIYDSFSDAKILFSWSSSIDIIKWSYDLSRRALIFKLPILSFREFLNIKNNLNIKKLKLQDILEDISNTEKYLLWYNISIKKDFEEYLKFWEFAFFYESKAENYILKLNNSLNKIIYEDISVFYKLKTENLDIFKEIIFFIVNSKPWLFSFESLAKQLKISADTLKNYVNILNEIWIISIIKFSWNISQTTRKAKKLYLSINNIYSIPSYNYCEEISWRIRESFFVNNIKNIGEDIWYSLKWDFELKVKWKKYIFEIWWDNKTKKQIKNLENSFLIKDNITWSEDKSTIPLWIFWLLY